MKKMRKQLFTILLAGSFIFSHQTSSACDCVSSTRDAYEGLQRADAVFIGRVVNSRMIEVSDSVDHPLELQVNIKVEKVLKGIKSKEVILRTGPGLGGDCGFKFQKGKEYLVFAYGMPNKLETSGCSRTKELKYAAEDIKEIKQGGKLLEVAPDKLTGKIVPRT